MKKSKKIAIPKLYIHEEVFKVELYFFLGDTRKSITNWIKKEFDVKYSPEIHKYSGMYFWVVGEDEKIIRAIWLEKFKNTPKDISLLSHEVNHLVEDVFKDIGSKGDDEAKPFYTEYWMRKILEGIQKDPI